VRRLVVALTALLAMVGAVVVVGYLLLFTAVADRAARATPADAAIYLKVYLQPSSGQKLNLLGLVGHLPGFRDDATLEEKIHEVAQRLLGEIGIDYAANLRPWLGGQVALAVAVPDEAGGSPQLLVLAAVGDAAVARLAVPLLMVRDGVTYAAEAYRGHEAMMSDGISYALLDDLLVVADTPGRLRAALDAEADTIPSLADSPAFGAAMRTVPADHLASLYVDLGQVAGLDAGGQLGGFATAALALTAEVDGLHLDGNVPFATEDASEAARAAFALGSKTTSLAAWMPRTTTAELGLFGLQQSLVDLEAEVGGDSALAPALDALSQLRLIAGVGLGINADRDLLPLFDGEAAVALMELDPATPHGLLLLRPSDPVTARAALDRMRDALVERGSSTSIVRAAGTTITSLAVPQVGRLSYALLDGVVLAGLDPADLAAALEAHSSGATLATDPRYAPTFEIAGAHLGTELWADIPDLLDAASGIVDPGDELRDILHQIGELAMSASTVGDQLEIHAVLTVR
jgi:hypothetical protein